MNWFYASNGSQQGPVSEDDLRALVQAGSINAATQIWKEGMSDWKTLAEARPDLAPASAIPAVNPGLKDLNVQAMREGALPTFYTGTLNYAGFWIRFAAKFIDGILMSVVQAIIQFGLGMVMALSSRGASPDDAGAAVIALAVLVMVLSLGVQALYYGLMVGKYGATLGKMACGLKVVMPDGSPVSMPRSFGRYFAEILSSLTICIGYIIAAFDDEKRALHDHIASTRVITVR
jgi:uncharacterized RDD family membrane protein YckC